MISDTNDRSVFMFARKPGLSGSKNTTIIPVVRRKKMIPTKIVGTTFATDGQDFLALFAREGKSAFSESSPKYELFLESEPDNEYDSDAVGVFSRETKTGKVVQLGYISNNERLCPACNTEYEKTKKASQAITSCENCQSKTIRNGLATRLSQNAKSRALDVGDLYEVHIAWDAGGITGGGKDTYGKRKSFGCNISLEEKPNV